jgi:hypothetical protein
MNAFCEWPLDWADCVGCKDGLSDADIVRFGQMAGERLWETTGRVFGVCEVTIRPCAAQSEPASMWRSTFWGRGPYPWAPSMGNGSWVPVLIGGQWTNITCGCVGWQCRCTLDGPTVLKLPGPVREISEVKVDGVVIPEASYRVDYNRLLIRTDGATWPATQNLLLDDTEPDTFTVTYERGIPVPIGGQIAAAVLAAEMQKASCGDKTCRLPERLQTVTRQGVTVGVALTGDDWRETGIWLIDDWIKSVTQPHSFASVRSIDSTPRY